MKSMFLQDLVCNRYRDLGFLRESEGYLLSLCSSPEYRMEVFLAVELLTLRNISSNFWEWAIRFLDKAAENKEILKLQSFLVEGFSSWDGFPAWAKERFSRQELIEISTYSSPTKSMFFRGWMEAVFGKGEYVKAEDLPSKIPVTEDNVHLIKEIINKWKEVPYFLKAAIRFACALAEKGFISEEELSELFGRVKEEDKWSYGSEVFRLLKIGISLDWASFAGSIENIGYWVGWGQCEEKMEMGRKVLESFQGVDADDVRKLVSSLGYFQEGREWLLDWAIRKGVNFFEALIAIGSYSYENGVWAVQRVEEWLQSTEDQHKKEALPYLETFEEWGLSDHYRKEISGKGIFPKGEELLFTVELEGQLPQEKIQEAESGFLYWVWGDSYRVQPDKGYLPKKVRTLHLSWGDGLDFLRGGVRSLEEVGFRFGKGGSVKVCIRWEFVWPSLSLARLTYMRKYIKGAWVSFFEKGGELWVLFGFPVGDSLKDSENFILGWVQLCLGVVLFSLSGESFGWCGSVEELVYKLGWYGENPYGLIEVDKRDDLVSALVDKSKCVHYASDRDDHCDFDFSGGVDRMVVLD